ncbi:Fic family protein [Micrococcales bacterium 31B]|nr:Fic family protein [Micrococcales bacterium 31B]
MDPDIARRHELNLESELVSVRALLCELQARFPDGLDAGIARYDVWLRNEMTYTSNAIEGNTLSSAETNLVVNEDAVIVGKSLREHLEAKDHAYAWDYMVNTFEKGETITVQGILELHRHVLHSTHRSEAGFFRSVPVRIVGSSTVLPNHLKVPVLVDDMVKQINQPAHNLNALIHAALIHLDFVKIHPFVDGNGRTARLLMSALLRRAGYPAVPIYPKDRAEYLGSLDRADSDDGADCARLAVRLQRETIEDLLRLGAEGA